MALPQGINFRNSAGFVSDGANEHGYYDYQGGIPTYPTTTAQGNDVGIETQNSSWSGRDRNSGNDRRLAGLTQSASSAVNTFRIDLPASGSHNVALAMGDASYVSTYEVDVRDTNTSLFSISGTTSAANSFANANNVERTAADWVTNYNSDKRSVTFSTTICRLRFDGNVTSHMPHFWIEAAGGGGRATKNTRAAPLGMEIGMDWRH